MPRPERASQGIPGRTSWRPWARSTRSAFSLSVVDKTLGAGKHENVKIWKLSVRDDVKEVVGLKQASAAKDLRVHDEEWMDIEVEPRSVLLIEEKA